MEFTEKEAKNQPGNILHRFRNLEDWGRKKGGGCQQADVDAKREKLSLQQNGNPIFYSTPLAIESGFFGVQKHLIGFDREGGEVMDKRKKRYYTMGQNNQDSRLQYWATRLSAPSFARTTRLLALHSLLRSHALLHSLICSLAHFAHSLTCGTVNDWIAIYPVFFHLWPIVHFRNWGKKGSLLLS